MCVSSNNRPNARYPARRDHRAKSHIVLLGSPNSFRTSVSKTDKNTLHLFPEGEVPPQKQLIWYESSQFHI